MAPPLVVLWHRAALATLRGKARVAVWYASLLVAAAAALALASAPPLDSWFSCGGERICAHSRHETMAHVFLLYLLLRTAFLLSLPLPSDADARAWVNDPRFTAQVGVVIPCHRSADEISLTLRAVVRHFPAENVVVVDNADAAEPPDDTAARVAAVDARVSYVYEGRGHKTNALLVGLRHLPPRCKYVLHVDDDTVLPEHFVVDPRKFAEPAVAAVAYGIEMGHSNAVQQAVDFELKHLSTMRQLQAYWATVWFCHGIVGLWRRERFATLLAEHPFLPFGEDGWLGMLNLLHNDRMEMEMRSFVRSYAPPTLLPTLRQRVQGYGASSIWKQRAMRWFVNAPRRIIWRLLLVVYYDCGQPHRKIGFVVFSITHLTRIWLAMIHLPLELFYMFQESEFGRFGMWFTVFYLVAVLESAIVNWVVWRNLPSLQVSWQTVLRQPLYYQFLFICTFVGHWRCALYYVPFFPMNYHPPFPEGLAKAKHCDLY
ncbi:hypothetical protein AB1Y20_012057 [Prymnesium parvum]|uniref:Ceramide glucosyltransferase n=1 Tax=Prymnesium parvum TaxID=97485 RepID=A0AB34IQ50_PRYPA